MYYNANWQLLEERIDDNLGGTPSVSTNQYVWGMRYIDDIVLLRGTAGQITRTYYQLTDAQFSTVALVSSSAVVTERVTYSAYGEARHHWLADVDGDGAVTQDDRDIIWALQGKTIADAEYRSEADLNRDGVIDNTDAALCR
jgi:hypothetical protein